MVGSPAAVLQPPVIFRRVREGRGTASSERAVVGSAPEHGAPGNLAAADGRRLTRRDIMDSDRFDKITRSLVEGSSRRKLLRGLVGGVFAGAAALVGWQGDEAAAAACPGGKVRCDGKCLTACTGGRRRDPNRNCRCVCPAAKPQSCGGQCRPACTGGKLRDPGTCGCVCPATKPETCNGQCLTACSGGRVRNQSTCGCECAPGSKECNGGCIPNAECCGGCTGGKTCQNGSCQCRYWELDCGGTCRECCSNFDCGPGGACNNGVCTRPPLFEDQADTVGAGKRIETTAELFGNDQMVVQARTINSSWVAGLRGRVLIVILDEQNRAIWVTDTIECRTRCSVPDPSCASEGLETFNLSFPAHPEAGFVIRKYARTMRIFHSDGPDPVTFADQWKQNILIAQDIAREIKELAATIWG